MEAVSKYMNAEGDEESIRLVIYDLGGQRVFYNLHQCVAPFVEASSPVPSPRHRSPTPLLSPPLNPSSPSPPAPLHLPCSLFLTRSAVYFVVFDMRKLVDVGATEPVIEGDPSAGEKPVLDVDGCLGFLRFWLCSLYLHARGAKCFLIGSHADEVPSADDHRRISERLEAEFGDSNRANGAGMLLGLGGGALDVEWNEADDDDGRRSASSPSTIHVATQSIRRWCGCRSSSTRGWARMSLCASPSL